MSCPICKNQERPGHILLLDQFVLCECSIARREGAKVTPLSPPSVWECTQDRLHRKEQSCDEPGPGTFSRLPPKRTKVVEAAPGVEPDLQPVTRPSLLEQFHTQQRRIEACRLAESRRLLDVALRMLGIKPLLTEPQVHDEVVVDVPKIPLTPLGAAAMQALATKFARQAHTVTESHLRDTYDEDKESQ